MMEGVVPPTLCTVSVDHMPNVSYLSLVEYVDPLHIALSYQFFNRSRENVLATKRAALTLDDPYTGARRGAADRIPAHRNRRPGVRASARQAHGRREPCRHGRGVPPARRGHLPRARAAPRARPQGTAGRRSRASTSPTNSRVLSERMAQLRGTGRAARDLVSTASANCCASTTRCCGCSTPRRPCSRCSRAAVTKSAARARRFPPAKASSAPRCAKACRSASVT